MVGSVIANSCFLRSPLCHLLVSDSSALPFSYTRNAPCRRKNRATMACLQRENSKQSDICARRAILFMGFGLVPFLGTRADAVDGYVVGWNRRGRPRNRCSIEKDTEMITQENTESRTQENTELRTQESTDLRTKEGAELGTQESTELKTQDRITNAEFDLKDGSAAVSDSGVSVGDALQVKEWEVGMLQNEVASTQGIRIRRRPPTGPPLHYVGPFEFRLQNEGNTPCNILEEIIWNKDTEVSKMKEKKPLLMLKKMLDKAPPVRDFVGSLKTAHSRTGLPGLIAEVKKASPSRGVLRDDFDPVQIAKAYEKGGAACLSVLTDEKYFQGSFENLEAIRSSGVQCPLLCKEFVIDAWQIYYARVKGADAILLIAAVLPDLDIKYMTKICKLLGLTALVEVHDEREMDRVLEIEGIELVGINNRNLGTFKVDIGNTKRLLEGERGQRIREKGIIVVGESGLFTPADIAFIQDAGVKAVLVGESIVKQTDPCMGITQLFGKDIAS